MNIKNKESLIKKISLCVIGFSVLFIIGLVGLMSYGEDADADPKQTAAQIEQEKKEAKEKLARQKENQERERQRELYYACTSHVQTLLKNPRSFDSEFFSAKYNDTSSEQVIVFDFYAQNGFGAEVLQSGVCTFDYDDNITDYAII